MIATKLNFRSFVAVSNQFIRGSSGAKRRMKSPYKTKKVFAAFCLQKANTNLLQSRLTNNYHRVHYHKMTLSVLSSDSEKRIAFKTNLSKRNDCCDPFIRGSS